MSSVFSFIAGVVVLVSTVVGNGIAAIQTKSIAPAPTASLTYTLPPNAADVLGESVATSPNIAFNIPAYFYAGTNIAGTSIFSGDITITNHSLAIEGTGSISAPQITGGTMRATSLAATSVTAQNLLYALSAGEGIALGGSDPQRPTVTNTGVLSIGSKTGALNLEAGEGIAIDGLKITNTKNTVYTPTAGTGIAIDGTTISNSDTGSAQNIFKTISVAGQNNITASSNTDGLSFVNGTGMGITTDPVTKTITLTVDGSKVNVSGFSDLGSVVALTTVTDSVGIGTTAPSAKLHVVGDTTLAGNVTLGATSANNVNVIGRLTSGSSILPAVDLGSDLGSASYRFNNIYVGTINSNSVFSSTGQAIFTYEPGSVSYTQSSVLINPTAPPTNSFLLGLGQGGNQRAGVDAEGDLIVGYSGGVNAPTTSFPVTVYGHGSTQVASIDTNGNATFTGGISVGGSYGIAQTGAITGSALSLTSNGLINTYISTANGNISMGGTGSDKFALLRGNQIATSTNPVFAFQTDTSTGLGTATTGVLSLIAGGTNVLNVNTSGYVGIGTTAPTYTLQIAANINDYASYIYNANTGTSAAGMYLRVDGSGNLLTLNSNGSDVFTVNSVQSSFNTPVSVNSPGDMTLAYDLNFVNPSAAYIKSYAPLYLASGDPFNSSDLNITTYNKGNVLVNSEAFAVSNSATVAAQLVAGTSVAPANIGGLYLTNAATYGKALGIFNQTENQDIFTASASGSTKFVIANNGNVGIGTSIPGTKFEVNGTIRVTTNTNNYLQMGAYNTSTDNFGYISSAGQSNGTGLKFETTNGAGAANGVTRMLIDNLGNVGIGTTTPTALLHTQGAVVGKALAIFNETGDQDLLTASASGVAQFTVSHAGHLSLAQTSAPTSTANKLYNISGNLLWNGINLTGGGALPAGTAGQTLYNTGGTWTASSFLYNSGSAIGINNTNPAALMDMLQTANTTAFSVVGASNTTATVASLSGNQLTSGNVLSLTSTSTALTTGSLLSLDWSPGSSTWATGDLFSLNIGANGNVTNLFNIKNNGSSVFSVSQAQVTAGVPLNVNSPGDFGIGNDLLLLNNTAANITSIAPLSITAGEVFGSSNITLGTYNKGNVLVNSEAFWVSNAATVSGQLVVGSQAPDSANIGNFYLTNDIVRGKALGIFNQTENQDIFTASASGSTKFVIANNGNVGIGTTNTTSALVVQGTASNSVPIFKVTDGTTIGGFMIGSYDPKLQWGTYTNDAMTFYTNNTNRMYIANTGGVSIGTYANTLGAGNFTVSGNVGLGTTAPISKLHTTGAVAGKALAIFDETGDQALLTASASGTTKFLVDHSGNVGIGSAAPSFPLDVAATISSSQSYGYLNSSGAVGTSAGTNSYSIRATGRVLAEEFNAVSDSRLKDVQYSLDPTVALSAIAKLQPVSYTWKNNPTGQPMIGFLAQDVEKVIPNAVSSIATANFPDQRELNYNQVLSVAVGAIKKLDERTKLILDTQGDLPTVLSQIPPTTSAPAVSLLNSDTNAASYTLLTNKLSDLDIRVASLSALLAASQLPTPSESGQVLSASVAASLTQTNSGQTYTMPAQLFGTQIATVEALMVSGQSKLYDVSVAGNLNVGLLNVNGMDGDTASLNALSGSLKLQSLAMGSLDIMGGKIVVDQKGNVSLTQGDLNIQKGKIVGNDSMRGFVKTTELQTTVQVNQTWTTVPVSITATAGFDSVVWVDGITTAGFTLHIKSPKAGTVYWSAMW